MVISHCLICNKRIIKITNTKYCEVCREIAYKKIQDRKSKKVVARNNLKKTEYESLSNEEQINELMKYTRTIMTEVE